MLAAVSATQYSPLTDVELQSLDTKLPVIAEMVQGCTEMTMCEPL